MESFRSSAESFHVSLCDVLTVLLLLTHFFDSRSRASMSEASSADSILLSVSGHNSAPMSGRFVRASKFRECL